MEALSSSLSPTRLPLLQAGGDTHSRFRLMLVHDGFQRIDRVIEDLKDRAFPANTEVLVVSVSDLFRSPLHLAGKSEASAAPRREPRRSLPQHRKTQGFFDKLDFIARQAGVKLRAAFPDWDIEFERPSLWQPDLVYFCPPDSSAVSELGLGEIIRKISNQSNIPFVVARRRSQPPASRSFSVIVFDGKASAEAILEELDRNPLDKKGEIYLLFYKDVLMSPAEMWCAGYEKSQCEWQDSQLLDAKRAIEALGYRVSCIHMVGNTAQAILQETRRVDAESVLLSFAGSGSSMRNVAATVAAQANCTVKILFAEREQSAARGALSKPQNLRPWTDRNESAALSHAM